MNLSSSLPRLSSRAWLIPALMIWLIMGGWFVLWVFARSGMDEGFLGLVSWAVIPILSVPILLGRRIDLFEPLPAVIGLALIGFTGKAGFVLIAGDSETARFLLRGEPASFLLPAATLLLLGLAALTLGYAVTDIRIKLREYSLFQKRRFIRSRVFLLSIVGILIGLLSFSMYSQAMGIQFSDIYEISAKRFVVFHGAVNPYGSLGYLLWGARLLSFLFYLLFSLFLVSKSGFRRAKVFGLVLLAVVVLALSILINSRQDVALFFINTAVLVHLLRGNFGFRKMMAFGAIGLVLLTSLSMIRSQVLEDLSPAATLDEVIDMSLGSRHFLDIAKTGHILEAVPKTLDLQYGTTLLNWVVAPVPRGLWADKPYLGSGKTVGNVVFGTPERTGVPPGFVGEMILNFGAFGVVPGMLLLGVALRVLFLSFRPFLQEWNGALLYIGWYFPLSFTVLNNDVSQAFVSLAIGTSVLSLMILFVSKPESHQTRGA